MKNNVENLELKREEILSQYGLDFRIEKLQLFGKREVTVIGENGLGKGIAEVKSDYYGLYNDKSGEVLSTCKKGYTVSQNDELVDLVLEGMKGFGELSVTKAGSLNGGRKVFMQLGIDGYSKVGGDEIKRYITVIDSNDGSTGLSVGIGDLTMSCQNQFYSFYKKGNAKWRHSASLTDKLKTIPRLIEMALAESMKQIELYRSFQTTKCSRDLANGLVKHITGLSRDMDLEEISTRAVNGMESLYTHIEKEMNQKGDNLWGLHSGVTSWTTHEKTAPKRENGRIESLMAGTNYKANKKSLEFVSTLINQ